MLIPNQIESLKNQLYLRNNQICVESFYETYYPIEQNYITICPDNNFKYWEELIQLIVVPLQRAGLRIVLISKGENLPHQFCEVIGKDLPYRHLKYIINNAETHVCGVDWSEPLCDKSRNILLYSDGERTKISKDEFYWVDRININSVENVAKKILESVEINYEILVNTKIIGSEYGNDTIEIIPEGMTVEECVPYISRALFVGMRMDKSSVKDYKFVSEIISLGVSPYVYIDSPLEENDLNHLKGCAKVKILDIEKFSKKDIEALEDKGIELILESKNTRDEEKAFLKNKFFDWKIFFQNEKKCLDIFEKGDMIKTCRFILSKDGLFASLAHWKQGFDVNDPLGFEFIDQEELEYFYVYGRN